MENALCLWSELAITPKADLERPVTFFKFAEYGDYWCNVAARSPADC